MAKTVAYDDHAQWEANGLLEYNEYAEFATNVNIRDEGDHSTGIWFYIDVLALNHIVIYKGTWGRYNSPGATSYTLATMYERTSATDMAKFEIEKLELESIPEYAEE